MKPTTKGVIKALSFKIYLIFAFKNSYLWFYSIFIEQGRPISHYPTGFGTSAGKSCYAAGAC
jgi:hypothetical protein